MQDYLIKSVDVFVLCKLQDFVCTEVSFIWFCTQEVIMMLDNSTRDFKSLIERLHTMKAYEDATKDGDRWEARGS